MDAFIECLIECFGEVCCTACGEGLSSGDHDCRTVPLLIMLGIVFLAAPVCLILGIVFLVKHTHYTAGIVLTVTGSVLTFLLFVWWLSKAIIDGRRHKRVKEIVRNAPPEKNLYRSGLVFDKKDKKSKTVSLSDEASGGAVNEADGLAQDKPRA